MKKALILLISFFICSHAFGYRVYGIAEEDSCGSWLQKRKKDDFYEMGYWLNGYVTAAGRFINLKVTDAYAKAFWLDDYCQKNPLVSFVTAVHDLVTSLEIKKTKK